MFVAFLMVTTLIVNDASIMFTTSGISSAIGSALMAATRKLASTVIRLGSRRVRGCVDSKSSFAADTVRS